MSTPATDATELGGRTPKVMGDPRNAHRGDVTDPAYVLALAGKVRGGGPRAVTDLSAQETIAIATLLCTFLPVVNAAIGVFEASDAGADKATMRARLNDLAAVTRPLMGAGA